MSDLPDLKTYYDIRRVADTKAFAAAMTFISWHNRLTMTPMLDVWEALVVTFAYEKRQIDPMLFSGVKSFLEQHRPSPPDSLESCRSLADDLLNFLSTK